MSEIPAKQARKSGGKSNRLPDGRVAPGRGPAPGAPNAGRPKGTYREWLMELLSHPDHRATFEAAIKGRLSDKDFAFATKHATAYAHGLPKQSLEISGNPERPVVIRQVRS